MSSLRFVCLSCVILTVAGICLANATPDPAAKAEAVKEKTFDPTGTWTWKRILEGNDSDSVLRLTVDEGELTGTYQRSGYKFDISNAEIKDGKVAFDVKGDHEGNKFDVKFAGKVKQDSIEGTTDLNYSGVELSFDWTAKRKVEPADVVGTWQFRIETPDGQVFEPKLVITEKDGKLSGKYDSTVGEFDAQDVTLKDNVLSFLVKGEASGQPFKVAYKAQPRGNAISGSIDYEIGSTGKIEFEGKRTSKLKDEKGRKTQKDESKQAAR